MTNLLKIENKFCNHQAAWAIWPRIMDNISSCLNNILRMVDIISKHNGQYFYLPGQYFQKLQSGASSRAKHGGAYFSAVYGSIQDPIAAPGLFDIQVP